MTAILLGGAYCWRSGLSVDADGSPRAYAPDNGGLHGLDHLRNAGRPGRWYGVATNDSGIPIIQGEHDPAPGFLVSTTALVDRMRAQYDPRRYVDSEVIPYIVVPPELISRGVHLGDVGLAAYGDRSCAAVIADVGPSRAYGEGSIALATALGIPADPRHGGAARGVSYICWPGSHGTPPWPRDMAAVAAEVATRLAEWGGLQRLLDVCNVYLIYTCTQSCCRCCPVENLHGGLVFSGGSHRAVLLAGR